MIQDVTDATPPKCPLALPQRQLHKPHDFLVARLADRLPEQPMLTPGLPMP
jgi:hypothetical protein